MWVYVFLQISFMQFAYFFFIFQAINYTFKITQLYVSCQVLKLYFLYIH